MLDYLGDVIEQVRRLSWGLSPASLEQFGLSTTINNLLEEFGAQYEISWSPEAVKLIDQVFSPLAQVNIYRIFQEILTNIDRHAQASRISVSLKQADDQISFTVEDNGRGFDMNKVYDPEDREKGIGLASMQERAQLAGGSLEIWSQPEAGTKITFTIPLDQGEASHGALSHPAG